MVVAMLACFWAPAASAAPKCDQFDPSVCLQPFPNDYFTKADPSTPTGRRIDLSADQMPRNAAGKPIQPDEWNRSDGFSPGSLITLHVPGLDNQAAFDRTGAVPIDDLQRSFVPNAPVVLLDAATLQRKLIWTELDANASSASVRNLIVRPAANLEEGHTYIVVLRNLRRANGDQIPAPAAFAGYRDGRTHDDRSAHMDWLLGRVKSAGINPKQLYLAWDFTVASEQSLSERMLHIRADAFGQLGDTNLADMKVTGSAPGFSVTKVEDFAPGSGPIARRVTGTFDVPCYLASPECQPGGGFAYTPGTNDPIHLPGNTYVAKFTCNVPWAATQSPARPSLYGHGLFGSTREVNQGQLKAMAQEHDFVFCATDWAGMSCETDIPSDLPSLLADAEDGSLATSEPNCDVPNVVTAIADLSRFNTMIDRVQEGMLAFLYLGRLMVHPDGLASDPAFKWQGKPTIDTSRLYYDGNSQGGIIGGALAAFMVDGNRSVIGVPGMNYSTLLQRSTDFGRGTPEEGPPQSMDIPSYAWLLYKAYPNEADRQVVFALMQMLWDRGEADGYAQHMTTDPLPGTPAHTVLMHLAFGDHQVSTGAAAVEARTIGARLRTPTLDTQRDPLAGGSYFGSIPAIPSYPWPGSAIVVWDSGPIRDDCQ